MSHAQFSVMPATWRPEQAKAAHSPLALLAQADRLMYYGYWFQAATTARMALDTFLRRKVAELAGCKAPKYCTIREYCEVLRKARYIDRESCRHICRLADVGNRAAHNYPVEEQEICGMLQGVWALCTEGGAA